MERKEKYMVLNLDDLCMHLTEDDHANLISIVLKVNGGRTLNGKTPKKYVCISDDLPIYEETWKALEACIDGAKKQC